MISSQLKDYQLQPGQDYSIRIIDEHHMEVVAKWLEDRGIFLPMFPFPSSAFIIGDPIIWTLRWRETAANHYVSWTNDADELRDPKITTLIIPNVKGIRHGIERKTVFKTSDGKEWDSYEEAVEHQLGNVLKDQAMRVAMEYMSKPDPYTLEVVLDNWDRFRELVEGT